MTKARHSDPDMADEYDFSGGRRVVYHERAKDGIRVSLVTDEEDELRRRADPSAKPARKHSS